MPNHKGKTSRINRKHDAPLGSTGVRINSGTTGPITVADRFTWKNLDPEFMKSCFEYTMQVNNQQFLHTETDEGPGWALVTVHVLSPDGVEYAVSFDPTKRRHFTMSTVADLLAYRAEQAEDERFFADAAKFDSLPVREPA